jgi:hypothetical protein
MAQSYVDGLRRLAAVALIQVATLVPGPARAQESTGAAVRINHATRTAYFEQNGKRRRIDVGERVRVPKPYAVRIVVDSTNSALYTCGVTATVAHVPELDSLRAYLTAVAPYLAGAMRLVSVPAAAESLRVALDSLDDVITGPRGLQWALRRTLEALDTLRFKTGPEIHQTAAELASNLWPVCDSTGCRSLVSGVLRAEANVSRQFERFRHDTALAKAHDTLVAAARAALAGEDKVVAAAYGVEAVVRPTLKASETMVCDSVTFSSDEGRDLTITVAPRPIPELARLADRRPYELKVTVLPKWGPRLAFSAAVMYAVDATFPTYNTTTTPPVQVIESGTQDLRWNYGLTLGLTWDWRHAPCHITWWPLELTVSPSTDNPGLGIGMAFSVGVFKAGVGALWLKHDQLDGMSVGQTLSDPNLLRKRSVLGSPRLYLSASLIGWQR